MADIVKTIQDNRETLKLIGSILPGAFAVAKGIYGFIGSPEAKRDKLLARIQGLLAARQALGPENDSNRRSHVALSSQIDQAVAQLGTTERAVEEKHDIEENLGWLQRAFLLYKPESPRAWVAHLISWVILLVLPFFFFGMSLPDDGGDSSWAAFKQNFWDSSGYFGLLFFVGVFLLARLWGIWEHKRYLRVRTAAAISGSKASTPNISISPREGFGILTIGAAIYGILGLTCIVGAGIAASDDLAAGIKFGLFGCLVLACVPALRIGGRRKRGILTRNKAILLFVPTLVVAVIIVFDIDGIILKGFAHDPIAYWRSWASEPLVPLFFVPLAALPLYAGARCLRAMVKNRGAEMTTAR